MCQSRARRSGTWRPLKVARVGRVEKSDDPLQPFRLVDADGIEVAAVSEFLHHMLADDASPTSLRSYAYELLAWVRFLRAVEVPWYLASRVEASDFALWLKMTKKPPRRRRPAAPAPGSVNPVTGKAVPGENYAARTRRHARAVIRSFYEYHRAGSRPVECSIRSRTAGSLGGLRNDRASMRSASPRGAPWWPSP